MHRSKEIPVERRFMNNLLVVLACTVATVWALCQPALSQTNLDDSHS